MEELEDRLLRLVGSVKIFSGGTEGKEHEMNNHIAEIIANATELKIVAPYITTEYSLILQDRVKNGVNVKIVLNDRRLWPHQYVSVHDKLKTTHGIDVINNPNVKYLLIWSPKEALFTSGPLSKESLMKTILIGTLVKERGKIEEILQIFNLMLPTFMR